MGKPRRWNLTLSAAPLTAARWFKIWMAVWAIFVAVLLITARNEKLTAGNVVPILGVHAVLFALAFWLAAGLARGRRVGAATALVGFFTLAGVAPAAVIASGGVRHDSPALLIAIVVAFWAITVRTLVALIVLLNRGQVQAHEGTSPPGESA